MIASSLASSQASSTAAAQSDLELAVLGGVGRKP